MESQDNNKGSETFLPKRPLEIDLIHVDICFKYTNDHENQYLHKICHHFGEKKLEIGQLEAAQLRFANFSPHFYDFRCKTFFSKAVFDLIKVGQILNW